MVASMTTVGVGDGREGVKVGMAVSSAGAAAVAEGVAVMTTTVTPGAAAMGVACSSEPRPRFPISSRTTRTALRTRDAVRAMRLTVFMLRLGVNWPRGCAQRAAGGSCNELV
jgi:hypothetical protein